MIEYMPYIWAAVTLAAICFESFTADLVTIWFIPAGILSLILSLIPAQPPVWIQVIAFFVCALVLLAMSKILFKRLFKKKPLVRTNLDAIVGETAIVTEEIDNIKGSGAVKVAGKEWSAITTDDTVIIEKNELVVIKEIRGVKLVCIKK